ncbi:MAG: hypothetical protein HYX63_13360 [Gammaproteobacteria bacterium]|nr:hypothetical protein [Gammaproteobacteria bacterium]
MQLADRLIYHTRWTIRRYADDAAFRRGESFSDSVIDGNLLLNEGIAELWDLVINAGTPTKFDNANARLGVGDSSATEAATQTDLQAATNKTYKAMAASYPQRAAQTVTWRAVFASADANYAWNEFTVDNGGTPLKNLNRKASVQGTKASGQTWTLDLAITLS